MTTLKRPESPQALLDTPPVPSVPRLPAVAIERRNLTARYALLRRIYREFTDMPGLSVTPYQAARLFGLPSDVVCRILQRLAETNVLRVRQDGQFALGNEEL
jgi:hypothetical protein